MIKTNNKNITRTKLTPFNQNANVRKYHYINDNAYITELSNGLHIIISQPKIWPNDYLTELVLFDPWLGGDIKIKRILLTDKKEGKVKAIETMISAIVEITRWVKNE